MRFQYLSFGYTSIYQLLGNTGNSRNIDFHNLVCGIFLIISEIQIQTIIKVRKSKPISHEFLRSGLRSAIFISLSNSLVWILPSYISIVAKEYV